MDGNPGPGRRLISLATIDIAEAVDHTPSLDVAAFGSGYGPVDRYQAAADLYIDDTDRRFYVYNGSRPATGSFANEDDGVALRQLGWTQVKKQVDRTVRRETMEFMETVGRFWKEIALAAGILVGAAIVAWLLLLFMQRVLRRLSQRTRSGLDDAILDAVRMPLITVVMLIAAQIALDQLTFLPGMDSQLRKDIFYALYLLVIYWFAFKLIDELMRWYIKEIAGQTETQLDEKVLPFVRRLALILLTLIAGIILLSYFDVDVSAMVTTLGITSLALALAAQNTLSDTISGLVIITDRPFTLGDRIEIQELNTWGDVQDIGLRSTRILTRDNRMVIVPNSAISKRLVVNHSVPSTVFRVQTHVGIGYGTDIDRARQVMIDAVRAQDWVMQGERVEALFVEYADSALIFRVRCWIENYEETRRTLDKLNSSLYRALYEAGIELPMPARTVYHRVDEADRAGVVAALREAR